MKNNKMFLVTAVILILLFIVFYAATTGPKPIDVKKYNMDVTVIAAGKRLGVNVDSDAIHFGKIPAGYAESLRELIVSNGETKANVMLRSTGVLGKWVAVSQNNFTMEPKQVQTLNLTASIPEGTPLGNYTGTLIIEFYKAE